MASGENAFYAAVGTVKETQETWEFNLDSKMTIDLVYLGNPVSHPCQRDQKENKNKSKIIDAESIDIAYWSKTLKRIKSCIDCIISAATLPTRRSKQQHKKHAKDKLIWEATFGVTLQFTFWSFVKQERQRR